MTWFTLSTEGEGDGRLDGADDGEKAVHVCNSCGARRPDRVFDMIVEAEMAAAGIDSDSSGDDELQQDDQAHEDDSGQEYDDVD